MKKFFGEFKKFATKGNVIDMAVGVVIGAAFTAIVNSLVKDIINPLIGLLTGGIDFGELNVELRPAVAEVTDAAGNVITKAKDALTLNYGALIAAILNFIIVAFVLFLVVRSFNKLKERSEAKKKAEEEAAKAAQPPEEPKEDTDKILSDIRDLLTKMNEK
ncbi:MAG: large-conductance mechanosensitive channel protein MscL [Clostridia bacterium]|nr:large-conductance mechanosensitive channel protein MscL [Clostridia bacterium]